ncbi:MAG: holo-ACP synthase [Streptococcaceae bacterium]|jgi:holo-[acyl-carrier protein] synthase|nr:holo-ACP synthase [Streptococcaceae bacterium]
MIYGIGIDNVELSRIEQASQHERFVDKVLTTKEKVRYENFSSDSRKIEFLAGRWAAKEAFSKAYQTGIGSQLHFLDLEIDNDDAGKPYFTRSPFDDKGSIQLSISHSSLEAVAFVILEKEIIEEK